jgi:hypothetical protein
MALSPEELEALKSHYAKNDMYDPSKDEEQTPFDFTSMPEQHFDDGGAVQPSPMPEPQINLDPLPTDPEASYAVASGNGTLEAPPSIPLQMPTPLANPAIANRVAQPKPLPSHLNDIGANADTQSPDYLRNAAKVAGEILPKQPTPGNTSDIENYLNDQKTQLDKYGPEQQKEVYDTLTKKYSGIGNQVALAAAGLADAIEQGVARAGEGHFMQNIQGREQQQIENAVNEYKNLNESQRQAVEDKMKMDTFNPGSSLSRAKQTTYAPLLLKLGYQPQQIGKMSSSDIENATNLAQQYGGKELENMVKQFEIQLQGKRLGFEEQKSQKELAQKGQEIAGNAAKTLVEQQAAHPFMGKTTGTEATQAAKTLQDIANPPVRVTSMADYSKLPSGTRYVDDSGQTKVKK